MIFSTVVKNDLHICSFPSTNIGRMDIFIQTKIVCPLPRVLPVLLVLQVTLDPQTYSMFSNPRLQNLTLSYAAYFYPLVPDVEGGEGADRSGLHICAKGGQVCHPAHIMKSKLS